MYIDKFIKKDNSYIEYYNEIFDFEQNTTIHFMKMVSIFFPLYGMLLFFINSEKTNLMITGLISTFLFSLFTILFMFYIKHKLEYKIFSLLRNFYVFCILIYVYIIGMIFIDTSYVVIYVIMFTISMLYLYPKTYIKLIVAIVLLMQFFSHIVLPINMNISIPFSEQFYFFTEDLIVVTFSILINYFHTKDRCRIFELERKLRNDRDIDGLTGLVNKRCFDEFLSLCESSNDIGCAILVDLDHFKEVNDSFGHDEGDFVLKEAAYILKNAFRENDCVARIGGDEFAIFFTTTIDEDEVLSLIRKKLKILLEQMPIIINKKDKSVSVTFSIGAYAHKINTGTSPKNILSNADVAMYKIKAATRDGACIQISDTKTETIFRKTLYK